MPGWPPIVGTGGGNHCWCWAAPLPEDSPFLRRPDLLKSMLGFWHNHPRPVLPCSAACSSAPPSQHPRIDEARDDATHELENRLQPDRALQRRPRPWLTDRVFRKHPGRTCPGKQPTRTEFCIDKMYDPNSAPRPARSGGTARFEMPPHARMSAAQMLLVRGRRRSVLAAPLRAPSGPLGAHPDCTTSFPVAAFLRGGFHKTTPWPSLSVLGTKLDPAWFAAPCGLFASRLWGRSICAAWRLSCAHAPGGLGTCWAEDTTPHRHGALCSTSFPWERLQVRFEPVGSRNATCLALPTVSAVPAVRRTGACGRIRGRCAVQGLGPATTHCIPPSLPQTPFGV